MKQVLRLRLALAFLLLTTTAVAQQAETVKNKTDNQKTKMKEDKMKMKGQGDMNMNMNLPYIATYSSAFVKGNDAYSKMVLKAWKGYDENNFSGMSDMFADTVTAYLADGTVLKGKQAVMDGVQGYRGTFSSVKSDVHAWMASRSVDKNEDWVQIWGFEEDTKADGSTSKVGLHELWRFDKAGKVSMISQFAQAPPKM